MRRWNVPAALRSIFPVAAAEVLRGLPQEALHHLWRSLQQHPVLWPSRGATLHLCNQADLEANSMIALSHPVLQCMKAPDLSWGARALCSNVGGLLSSSMQCALFSKQSWHKG